MKPRVVPLVTLAALAAGCGTIYGDTTAFDSALAKWVRASAPLSEADR